MSQQSGFKCKIWQNPSPPSSTADTDKWNQNSNSLPSNDNQIINRELQQNAIIQKVSNLNKKQQKKPLNIFTTIDNNAKNKNLKQNGSLDDDYDNAKNIRQNQKINLFTPENSLGFKNLQPLQLFGNYSSTNQPSEKTEIKKFNQKSTIQSLDFSTFVQSTYVKPSNLKLKKSVLGQQQITKFDNKIQSETNLEEMRQNMWDSKENFFKIFQNNIKKIKQNNVYKKTSKSQCGSLFHNLNQVERKRKLEDFNYEQEFDQVPYFINETNKENVNNTFDTPQNKLQHESDQNSGNLDWSFNSQYIVNQQKQQIWKEKVLQQNNNNKKKGYESYQDTQLQEMQSKKQQIRSNSLISHEASDSCQMKVSLNNSKKSKQMEFNCFTDKELGVSVVYQGMLENQVVDDDCDTDDETRQYYVQKCYKQLKKEIEQESQQNDMKRKSSRRYQTPFIERGSQDTVQLYRSLHNSTQSAGKKFKRNSYIETMRKSQLNPTRFSLFE